MKQRVLCPTPIGAMGESPGDDLTDRGDVFGPPHAEDSGSTPVVELDRKQDGGERERKNRRPHGEVQQSRMDGDSIEERHLTDIPVSASVSRRLSQSAEPERSLVHVDVWNMSRQSAAAWPCSG